MRKRWRLVRIEVPRRPLTEREAWRKFAGLVVLAVLFGFVLGLVLFGLLIG